MADDKALDDDKALAEIRTIAHRLWVEDGRPDGQDRRHWEAAKEIWAFQQAGDDEGEGPSQASQLQASQTPPADARAR